MLLDQIDLTSIPVLSTAAGPIQRVTDFKLLGLHLDASLSWTTHIIRPYHYIQSQQTTVFS